jgi:uncharacterized protein
MAARIRVRAAPGARTSAVAGRYADGWRVRVAAPPAGGRANRELARYLAGLVGVAPSQVTVVAGAGSRDKVVELAGVDARAVAAALDRASAGAG